MARKYQYYKIVATKNSKILFENDIMCYKSALAEYNDIKERYEGCSIEFLGVSDTLQEFMFGKDNPDDGETLQETTETQNENIIDLFSELNDTLKKIDSREKGLQDEYRAIESSISYIYHVDIENHNSPNEQHMIDTYKKLESALNKRRGIKHELNFIQILNSNNVNHKTFYQSIDKIDDCLGKQVRGKEKSIQSIQNYASESTSEVNIANSKYYKYNNQKDKENLISQLKCKWKIVVEDNINSQLICRHELLKEKCKQPSVNKEVDKLVKSNGGSIKYKNFEHRDKLAELLEDKFHTVFVDNMSMKITCGNLKKGL